LHDNAAKAGVPRAPVRATARVVKRADTRRRLLTAAREMFRARGVDQVPMEDIAAAAAASRATIYLYFPGKPSLLEALLEEDWAGQVRLFERLRQVSAGDRDQIAAWVVRVAEGMRKARDSFGIHWAAMGQNPALTVRHHEHRAELAKLLLLAMPGAAPAELARTIEAELIVAEVEHFATAAAIGWSALQMAAALPLVTTRIYDFGTSGHPQI